MLVMALFGGELSWLVNVTYHTYTGVTATRVLLFGVCGDREIGWFAVPCRIETEICFVLLVMRLSVLSTLSVSSRSVRFPSQFAKKRKQEHRGAKRI